MSKAQLFLSHSHEDAFLAKILTDLLLKISDNKIKVWFSSDRSIKGGLSPGKWYAQLDRRLKNSTAIIAILTPRSIQSRWVYFETGYGEGQKCKIIPICIGVNINQILMPLNQNECYPISDYGSFRKFIGDLLKIYNIPLDEDRFRNALQNDLKKIKRRLLTKEKNISKIQPVVIPPLTKIPSKQIRNVFQIPSDNKKRDKRMKQIYSQKPKKLRLLALSGSSFFQSIGFNWKYGFSDLLENGCEVQVLLSHPAGEEASVRKKAERRKLKTPFLKVPLPRYKELVNEYENLEIKFTRLPIYCSLIMWDKGFLYDPYHLGCLPNEQDSQNQFIVAEFSKGKYYNLMSTHFDFLWKQKNGNTVSLNGLKTK